MKVISPNSHILGVLFVFEFTSLAYGDGKGNAIGPGQNVVEIYHLLFFWRDFFKEQTIKAEEPICVCVAVITAFYLQVFIRLGLFSFFGGVFGVF